MKRTFKIFALILVAGLIYAGHRFLDPEEAAMNCPEIQRCLSQGYQVQSCVQQPIYYYVQPTGIYDWGQVTTELRCDPVVAGEPVSITCNITAKENFGRIFFWETGNHVHAFE